MKNKTRESELPDLEGPEGNQAIIADNIRALQPVYFAAMLDKLKAFLVLDRLVELFQTGMLPVEKGKQEATYSSIGRRNRFASQKRSAGPSTPASSCASYGLRSC